ncbi:DUF5689 domain-containing protein [Flaviaesturariibacter amylovorans]|uniref:DUF5689 domain-containing protein n=1 Tax=Flaviaesturariibacter amylovorans TaxID=1084520 RepID=A0ABP8GJI8_9BACT
MNLPSFIKNTRGVALMALVALAACNKQPVGPTGPDPYSAFNYTNLAAVRALYSGADAAVPANTKKIRATVVSNRTNEAAGNYRIQDESGRGINLFLGTGFTDTAKLRLGSVVDVNINGGTVGKFNGDMQIRGLDATAFSKIDSNKVVTPRVATVRQVIDSIQDWSSTVVKIENVTIATSGNPSATGQNYNITDATGTIVTFVRATSGIVLPTGNAQSFTGYVSIFQSQTTGIITPQVIVRTLSDVVPGGPGANGNGFTLGNSPVTFDFNNIGNGMLPAGVSVRLGARGDTVGASANFNSTTNTSLWKTFTAGFKNYASATGLNMGTDSATQVAATNRALGVRQTGTLTTGGDPGAAFVFLIANTTGKNNLKMDFQLQSLDTASNVNRTTTWVVDYALGDNPTTFTAVPAANITGTLTTGNRVFSNNAISVTFPAAVSNQNQKVWVRIATLAPSTGSQNRGTAAIDDVKFTWN